MSGMKKHHRSMHNSPHDAVGSPMNPMNYVVQRWLYPKHVVRDDCALNMFCKIVNFATCLVDMVVP